MTRAPIDCIARLSDRLRGINNTSRSYHTIHPLYRYTTLCTNYDYKSHILSATNNLLLPLPALHLQYATYRITHGCGCFLTGYCTPTQCQSRSRAGLFVTDSLVTPVGYTSCSCRRDRQVELAASVADWLDQTVCHK